MKTTTTLTISACMLAFSACGGNSHASADNSYDVNLTNRRLDTLYSNGGADKSDPKRQRLGRILLNLAPEDASFLATKNIKVDLATMPKGITMMIENNTIKLNIMGGAGLQNAIRFIKNQKEDGLPYQPACFTASYNFNQGLAPFPVGC